MSDRKTRSFAVGAASVLFTVTLATASPAQRHWLEYLPLPSGVKAADLHDPSPVLVQQLLAIELAALASSGSAESLFFFIDRSGNPVRPDADRARATTRTTPGDITFSFESPDNPWDADQLAALQDLIALIYPVAVEVYGPPAFTNTVNIRQLPGGGAAYSASLNQIYLSSVDNDQLCHEILHAFRDDIIVALKTFEEGMVRAAEVEVFNRLPGLEHWDEHHGYYYDQWFEVLDRPAAGSVNGQSWDAAGLLLLRYQLSGYAWAKPLLESSGFLTRFNQGLLVAALANTGVTRDEDQLVALAAVAQPVVEDLPLPAWYRSHGVFDSAPPLGWILYQRLNQYTVDLFFRSWYGYEEELADHPVSWSVTDNAGYVLDWGEVLTNYLGVAEFYPAVGNYRGRMEVCVTTTVDGHSVTDCGLRPTTGRGVFGVVATHDGGTVTVTDLDGRLPPQSAAVVNGAFELPSLTDLAGRFVADFEAPDGTAISHRFTKDASSYVLVLGHDSPAPRRVGERHRP